MDQRPVFTVRRRGMSAPVAAAVTAIIVAALFTGWAAALVWLGCAYALIRLARLMIADRRSLALEADAFVLLDAAGREVGRIALARPFELEYLSRGYHEDAYRITQDNVALTFTNRTRGAPRIVCDVLGLPPPDGRWRYGETRD